MADFIWQSEAPLTAAPAPMPQQTGPRVALLPRAGLWQVIVPPSRAEAFAECCKSRLGITPAAGAVSAGLDGDGHPVWLIWSALDQYFLTGAPDVAGPAAAFLSETAYVLDQGDGRAVFAIAGAASEIRAALSRLLPLDLREAAFGPGRAVASEIDLMPVNLWCLPGAGEGRILVHLSTFRSFARSLAAALETAGLSFAGAK